MWECGGTQASDEEAMKPWDISHDKLQNIHTMTEPQLDTPITELAIQSHQQTPRQRRRSHLSGAPDDLQEVTAGGIAQAGGGGWEGAAAGESEQATCTRARVDADLGELKWKRFASRVRALLTHCHEAGAAGAGSWIGRADYAEALP